MGDNAVAFNPKPTAPVDAGENPIAFNAAVQRNLQTRIDKWMITDRTLVRACSKNVTTKTRLNLARVLLLLLFMLLLLLIFFVSKSTPLRQRCDKPA